MLVRGPMKMRREWLMVAVGSIDLIAGDDCANDENGNEDLIGENDDGGGWGGKKINDFVLIAKNHQIDLRLRGIYYCCYYYY